MMMVEAEEGSAAAEFCRAENEEIPDDAIDLDTFWRILGEPSNPPQVNHVLQLFPSSFDCVLNIALICEI